MRTKDGDLIRLLGGPLGKGLARWSPMVTSRWLHGEASGHRGSVCLRFAASLPDVQASLSHPPASLDAWTRGSHLAWTGTSEAAAFAMVCVIWVIIAESRLARGLLHTDKPHCSRTQVPTDCHGEWLSGTQVPTDCHEEWLSVGLALWYSWFSHSMCR